MSWGTNEKGTNEMGDQWHGGPVSGSQPGSLNWFLCDWFFFQIYNKNVPTDKDLFKQMYKYGGPEKSKGWIDKEEYGIQVCIATDTLLVCSHTASISNRFTATGQQACSTWYSPAATTWALWWDQAGRWCGVGALWRKLAVLETTRNHGNS